MPTDAKKTHVTTKKHGHRHLTPLEVVSVTEAVQRGTRVAELAKKYGTSRQTIYNAIETIHEGRIKPSEAQKQIILPPNRTRIMRISPEIINALVELKRKYPTWGVQYLRSRWLQMGKPAIAKSTIYKIFKNAQLITVGNHTAHHYERFEMIRPGQLYQMDIEGKIYLTGIGWVYGFAVIDDYSRFVVACQYYTEERLSNGILTLNAAIIQYGIPDAIYVDNGSQFVSRGERMNNFELFCQAYGIQLIKATPDYPEGKGKIERFFKTLEDQCISEVKQKLQEQPGFSLNTLNHEVKQYLDIQYHPRIHGSTHEKPLDRFGKGTLRSPDPIIDVQKFLERSETRSVNKFNEISYQGYKIQVDLTIGAKVNVVEMLETIRIEYQNTLVREINKMQLTKEVRIKHQDGVSDLKANPNIVINPKPIIPVPRISSSHQPDAEGFYHRTISTAGVFKLSDVTYYIGSNRRHQAILIQITENLLRIYDPQKNLLMTMDKRIGKKY